MDGRYERLHAIARVLQIGNNVVVWEEEGEDEESPSLSRPEGCVSGLSRSAKLSCCDSLTDSGPPGPLGHWPTGGPPCRSRCHLAILIGGLVRTGVQRQQWSHMWPVHRHFHQGTTA